MRRASTVKVAVERLSLREARITSRTQRDVLATEEPLEIRVALPETSHSRSADQTAWRLAVTMRTPGADFDLAAGFLFGEGLIHGPDDIAAIRYCLDPAVDGAQNYNVVNVVVGADISFDAAAVQRNFYVSSSCGICGKASIEAVMELTSGPVEGEVVIGARTLLGLPDRLREEQTVFERTGGLHAAARFSPGGRLLAVREDVGRHNAMDKLIGAALLNGDLPLAGEVVVVSGRLSFELVQKAARAGVPLLAGVSAPSSLAVQLGKETNITLVGFLRDGRCNVYAGHHRIQHKAQSAGPEGLP